MIVAGSILGALLGGIIGSWVGLALVGDEAAGWMTRTATVTAVVAGSIGIVFGAILGGTAGWAFKVRRK